MDKTTKNTSDKDSIKKDTASEIIGKEVDINVIKKAPKNTFTNC